MSIHTARSQRKAREMGGFAGVPEATELWSLSKREILEVAIRFGAQLDGSCDDECEGIEMVKEEIRILRAAEII